MDGGQNAGDSKPAIGVVEADDTQVFRNLKTLGPCSLHDTRCAIVGHSKDGGRRLGKAKQCGACCNAVFETGPDVAYVPTRDGDAFGLEGSTISVQPGLVVGEGGVGSQVGDATVSEGDEVLGRCQAAGEVWSFRHW
jgi:hypothetical protein